jgi:hypothetical protein
MCSSRGTDFLILYSASKCLKRRFLAPPQWLGFILPKLCVRPLVSNLFHIKLTPIPGIPYIRAFTMPYVETPLGSNSVTNLCDFSWTRTQSYPHAFLSPPVEVGSDSPALRTD